MTKEETLTWIRRSRIVPVIRASSAEEALEAVGALIEGGIDVLEITMTVPGAIEVMRVVANLYSSSALVGAGTVMNAQTATECVEAGARFIVSPALNISTIEVCHSMGIVVAPGALTPTEVVTAWNAGADMVKIFPCDALGGPSYIKSLKAPLPHIPMMPTGGVTLENAAAFFRAGADAVGVGTNLVDLKLLREGRREELVTRSREFRAAA